MAYDARFTARVTERDAVASTVLGLLAPDTDPVEVGLVTEWVAMVKAVTDTDDLDDVMAECPAMVPPRLAIKFATAQAMVAGYEHVAETVVKAKGTPKFAVKSNCSGMAYLQYIGGGHSFGCNCNSSGLWDFIAPAIALYRLKDLIRKNGGVVQKRVTITSAKKNTTMWRDMLVVCVGDDIVPVAPISELDAVTAWMNEAD